jgi:hypothetical protein
MKSRVIEQIESAGKESIIKWWDHDSGSLFINGLIRKAVLDYAEKTNKFAYELWMHRTKHVQKNISQFFELDEKFSNFRGYELVSEWSHVAVEPFADEKARYKCITGEIYHKIDTDQYIVAGIDVDKNEHPCFASVHKSNVHYFPAEVHQSGTYIRETMTCGIASMIKPIMMGA